MDGHYEQGFSPLAEALEATIAHMGGGAALSVFVDGRPVFDMWGGARNAEGEPWQRDTTSVSYSTTKGVISTGLHLLADRGLVEYEAPVARYWPEFAQNGKADITVADVMSHRAGLHDVRNLVVHADTLLDWEATVETLARAPAAPATAGRHAYHAVTYGHLVGEIIRRVSGQPVSEFVRREIAEPLGLSGFWIGAPPEAIPQAARLVRRKREKPPIEQGKGRRRRRPRTPGAQLVRGLMRATGMPASDPMLMRDAFYPRGIERWDPSSPRVLAACVPSFNGLFTARDLARMYACLACGGALDGVRLISEDTLGQATRVHSYRPDSILIAPLWRLGYHGVVTTAGVPLRAFGHFGLGGSGAWADPDRRMSLAFTVNVGSGTPVGDWRIFKLSGLALSCVKRLATR